MGCTSTGATPPAPARAGCRSGAPRPRRTASTWARTCNAAAAPARSACDTRSPERSSGRGPSAPPVPPAQRPRWAEPQLLDPPPARSRLRLRLRFTRNTNLGNQLSESLFDARQAPALGELGDRRARDDDQILPVLEPSRRACERLAQQPLYPVALHRIADPARDRHPQARAPTRFGRGVPERVQHEVTVRGRAAASVNPLELRAARQAAATRRPRVAHAQLTLRPTAACAPCCAGASAWSAPRACACGRGTRVYGRACASSAGMCASSCRSPTTLWTPARASAPARVVGGGCRPSRAPRGRSSIGRRSLARIFRQ